MVALPRRLVEGVVAMAALLLRLMDGVVVMAPLAHRLMEEVVVILASTSLLAIAALLHRLMADVVVMAALAHRAIEGVVFRALAQRPIEAMAASLEASTSFLAAVGASKSSRTRSSSEMQRARARACPWRTQSGLAAVLVGHDGGSRMPLEVKTMWRQGIALADATGDSVCSCACFCLWADTMRDRMARVSERMVGFGRCAFGPDNRNIC